MRLSLTDHATGLLLRNPWWWIAALVALATLLAPDLLGRLDLAAYELLAADALPGTAGEPPGPRASPWVGLLAAVLPLLLMGAASHRLRQHLAGRSVLALAMVPYGVAWVGLVFGQRWLPPTMAALGWVLGYAMWRSGQLRDARSALRQARGHADATLRALTDAVFTVDAAYRVQLMNPVARSMAAVHRDAAEGRPITELLRLGGRDARRLGLAISSCLREQRVIRVAQPVALLPQSITQDIGRGQDSAAATERLLRVIASPVIDGAAPGSRAVLVMSDVTDSVQTSARLQHEASHDPLTGLPNRVSLTESFGLALARARQAHRELALLFIDLDRFKRINDSLGHHHGDTVLKLVAERLRERVQAYARDATLVRWGGDEFVVLVEDAGDGAIAQGLSYQLMSAVSRSIDLDELDVQCSCSIGLALAPAQADTLDALLTLADTGMRRAKLHGGSRVEFSAPYVAGTAAGTGAPPWTRDVLTLEARLRHALAGGELELHYQPQLDVVSGEPVGLEALLRWRQADGVVWSPSQFLDVAEESGLILEIGAWAIREATCQLGRWRRAGVLVLPVAINVSARQCLDRRLVQVVSAALAAEDIPASLLKLEITETTAMADVEQVMLLLAELRALGVGVAVDDFGTGYSSLAHLQRLPIDQIKIDQSFVRDIANDRQGAAIVRATIALAHELGVPVVAEGVEHEAQLTFLTLHRCDIAQGYYFARPLSGEATGTYLRDAQRAAGAGGQPALSFG